MNVDPHFGFLNSLPPQRQQGNVWSILFFFLTPVCTFGKNVHFNFKESKTVLRISDERVQEI